MKENETLGFGIQDTLRSHTFLNNHGIESFLLGIIALIVLFLFWPGVKQAIKESKKVENPDWKAALFPIGLVVFFVVILIMFTRD